MTIPVGPSSEPLWTKDRAIKNLKDCCNFDESREFSEGSEEWEKKFGSPLLLLDFLDL